MSEPVDLRSDDDRRVELIEYVLRVAVILSLALAASFAVGAASTLGSATLLSAENDALTGEAEALARSARDKQTGDGVLESLAGGVRVLSALDAAPRFAEAVDRVLAVPRSGIRVTRIAFDASVPEPALTIGGIAASRDALRSYVAQLEEDERITRASFPLSDLARDENLSFTVTAILTP